VSAIIAKTSAKTFGLGLRCDEEITALPRCFYRPTDLVTNTWLLLGGCEKPHIALIDLIFCKSRLWASLQARTTPNCSQGKAGARPRISTSFWAPVSEHDEFLGELAVATYCYGNIQNLSLIGALAEVCLLTWLLRPR
jgi:hypothetical protein